MNFGLFASGEELKWESSARVLKGEEFLNCSRSCKLRNCVKTTVLLIEWEGTQPGGKSEDLPIFTNNAFGIKAQFKSRHIGLLIL